VRLSQDPVPVRLIRRGLRAKQHNLSGNGQNRSADPVRDVEELCGARYPVKRWPMPVQVFRYFNVYGPHEHHKDQPSPFSRFRLQAAATGRIEVYEGSDEIYRDFVPVERVVEVHKRFFDLDVSGVYNLGTGKAQSFMDVARTVALETNAEIVTVPMPEISGYQRYTQADMTKTTALL
jgi:nucleoside-diphosphate-sugar epimerase